MKILYPEVFWLLLVLILLVIPAVFNYRKGRKTLELLAGQWRNEESSQVYFIKSLIYWITIFLFFIFSIMALAGMRWGKTAVKDESSGLDLVIAVDISRSMLADDIAPSRLTRAAEGISYILNSFGSTRSALVIFKGEGNILVPLTEDRILMESALRSLSPDLYTVPGSDIELGIRSALDAFPPGSPGKKAILFVSDGESLTGTPSEAAREAYLQEVPLFILGAGTSEGMVLRDESGNVIKDKNGQAVITSLEEEVLRDLAELSGGIYYNLSDPRSLGELVISIRELTAAQDKERIVSKDQKQYRIFVVLALFFLVLNLSLGGIRWSRWF
ncbi:MAG: hypothetical protein B6241_12140 [Spirochaetaceae bacterium 4572_59]|nr:MAG: hypothetical protein B6241_12140 [Spirochaetaceae bacterium 4572_59]